MRYLRRHRFFLSFLALLVVCGVMVINQFRARQAAHVELREAFILLHTRGYKKEANSLYQRLVREVDKLPNKGLIDDFQRTLLLVDPTANQSENLIWRYHWTVSNELEKRSDSMLQRARKLAEEKN